MSLLPVTISEDLQESFLFKQGSTVEETDAMIWTALRQGNRKALNYIFEKYVRLLYSYGGKIIRDQGIVEDCIQDLFVELWVRQTSLSETDNIKFYLLKSLRRKIARRVSIDHRNLDVENEELSGDMEFSIEFEIIQQQVSLEQQEQLSKAISRLSERQREAVYLKFYEMMSYEQLSEVLGINLKSTYKLIGKAVDALRRSVKIN